ncbi:dihydropyrimidinase [Clostridium sediminicola]|uniref:dihydropyrimidinase n=1 Tax=Clostridium sediminicola TaxID=3114879 RepID=UPI0031F24899
MFIIKDGTIVSSTESYKADIKIKNGIIIEIGEKLKDDSATIIDAKDCLVFPGFIDAHTHFDLDTGVARSSDDFSTGTKAAILGGTTSIIDFANQYKGEGLVEALDNWHKKAENISSCDYGFHMSITDWNDNVAQEIEEMFKRGVSSFKLYMAYDIKVNDGEIYEILSKVKEYGGIVSMHCENGELVKKLTKIQLKKGNTAPSAHPLSRPNYVEAEAISRYTYIAGLVDVPVNIVHLSTAEGLEEARKARKRGQKVYVETCPQYLLFDDSKYALYGFEGAKYILSPPLRKQKDIDELWNGIRNKEIDTIGTDHCSFNFEQKKIGIDDFSKIPNGIPGVEHRPALIYTYGVNKNIITQEQMCGLLSENIAKMLNVYPQKGTISVGSDADIVIWNKTHREVISWSNQSQNVDHTPYEGIDTLGKAKHVFLRGKHVVQNGKLALKNTGRFISRG